MSRLPPYDMSVFKMRRQRIAKDLKDSALVIFANPEFLRNHDANYEYRQDTNFFYLTGFEEPESVMVYRPGQKPEYVLFVRPKDLLRETWDGFRYGPEGARKAFGADEVYLISELDQKLPDLLKSVNSVYYRLHHREEHDRIMIKALDACRTLFGRSGRGIQVIHDAWEFLGEYRLMKQDYDIERQKKASELTAVAHLVTMMNTRAGQNERNVDAKIRYAFMEQNSVRMGYTTIVAGGKNACTLHYNFNDQKLNDGDLLLIDAGTENEYFSGDITRTYPVNGKFTSVQKEFYQHVLSVQKKIIEMIKPGIAFKTLQDTTISLLVDAMLDLKLVKGNKDEIIKSSVFKKYYPHGVSHWLGMDVHDSGLYQVNGESRKIEAGMVFTVEPGLYVPHEDESAPKELRGLGVRIEDNIVVTATGCDNMTWKVPKEIDEMEAIIGLGCDVGMDKTLENVLKAFEKYPKQEQLKSAIEFLKSI